MLKNNASLLRHVSMFVLLLLSVGFSESGVSAQEDLQAQLEEYHQSLNREGNAQNANMDGLVVIASRYFHFLDQNSIGAGGVAMQLSVRASRGPDRDFLPLPILPDLQQKNIAGDFVWEYTRAIARQRGITLTEQALKWFVIGLAQQDVQARIEFGFELPLSQVANFYYVEMDNLNLPPQAWIGTLFEEGMGSGTWLIPNDPEAIEPRLAVQNLVNNVMDPNQLIEVRFPESGEIRQYRLYDAYTDFIGAMLNDNFLESAQARLAWREFEVFFAEQFFSVLNRGFAFLLEVDEEVDFLESLLETNVEDHPAFQFNLMTDAIRGALTGDSSYIGSSDALHREYMARTLVYVQADAVLDYVLENMPGPFETTSLEDQLTEIFGQIPQESVDNLRAAMQFADEVVGEGAGEVFLVDEMARRIAESREPGRRDTIWEHELLRFLESSEVSPVATPEQALENPGAPVDVPINCLNLEEGCYEFYYRFENNRQTVVLQGMAQPTDLMASYPAVEAQPVYRIETPEGAIFYLVYLEDETTPPASLLIIPDYEREAYIPFFIPDLIQETRIINGYSNGRFGIILPGFTPPQIEIPSNVIEGTTADDIHYVRLLQLEEDAVAFITEPPESSSFDVVEINLIDGFPILSATLWILTREGDDLHMATASVFDDGVVQRGTLILTGFFSQSPYEILRVRTMGNLFIDSQGQVEPPQAVPFTTVEGEIVMMTQGTGGLSGPGGAQEYVHDYSPLEFLGVFGYQEERTINLRNLTIENGTLREIQPPSSAEARVEAELVDGMYDIRFNYELERQDIHIRDSDGLGQIVLNGIPILGTTSNTTRIFLALQNNPCVTDMRVYNEMGGQILRLILERGPVNQGDLIIYDDTYPDHRIIIENFHTGMFGIDIPDCTN